METEGSRKFLVITANIGSLFEEVNMCNLSYQLVARLHGRGLEPPRLPPSSRQL